MIMIKVTHTYNFRNESEHSLLDILFFFFNGKENYIHKKPNDTYKPKKIYLIQI